jgi:hypothetical protein
MRVYPRYNRCRRHGRLNIYDPLVTLASLQLLPEQAEQVGVNTPP